MGRDYERANLATAEISGDNNLLFEGALFTRNAIAEVRAGVAAAAARRQAGRGRAARGGRADGCSHAAAG